MNSLVCAMREDFRGNRGGGMLTVAFLWNYRLGRRLLMMRRKGIVTAWAAYVPAVVVAKAMGLLFGCSVPFSCELGRRIVFPHGLYGIFISGLARVGNDCAVMHQVTIGSNFLPGKADTKAPVIGDWAFIGAGAKVIGGITIGERVKIGANALVVEDVAAGSTCRTPKAEVMGPA